MRYSVRGYFVVQLLCNAFWFGRMLSCLQLIRLTVSWNTRMRFLSTLSEDIITGWLRYDDWIINQHIIIGGHQATLNVDLPVICTALLLTSVCRITSIFGSCFWCVYNLYVIFWNLRMMVMCFSSSYCDISQKIEFVGWFCGSFGASCSVCLFKLPFMHESLLLDQKDQKLTQSEKRLAQQSYEHDKLMSGRPSVKSYSPPQPALRRLYSPPPLLSQDNSNRFLLVLLDDCMLLPSFIK